MQPAIFIARLVGPLFVVLGVGILANLTLYADMVGQSVAIPTLIYLAGLLSLAAGLAILIGHHAWTADWRVIITLLGWVLVIAGIIRIVLPRATASMATTIYSGRGVMAIAGVVVLVLGLYLGFEGYRRRA